MGSEKFGKRAKLRGRGYSKAEEIICYAKESVGFVEGTAAGKEAVKWFAEKAMELEKELERVEEQFCFNGVI